MLREGGALPRTPRGPSAPRPRPGAAPLDPPGNSSGNLSAKSGQVQAQEEGLLKGRKIAIDATTLEANAAMRTIVRRADGASYQKYLKKLARAEGIKDPTPEDLGRMDRKRKGKKVSNKEWKSSSDSDARITKMKDGTTHLAHKAEHAVDLGSGVIVAAEIHPADSGDTKTVSQTLRRAEASVERANPEGGIQEVVADRGYHSGAVVGDLHDRGYNTCIPERRQKGRRNWKKLRRKIGDQEARRRQRAFYRNRRRLKSDVGKRLLKKRGETVERSFAHVCETGGMRRVHLRGRLNILKRYQVHVAAFNLSILLRALIGLGTPRGFQGRKALLAHALSSLLSSMHILICSLLDRIRSLSLDPRHPRSLRSHPQIAVA
jgi:transposase